MRDGRASPNKTLRSPERAQTGKTVSKTWHTFSSPFAGGLKPEKTQYRRRDKHLSLGRRCYSRLNKTKLNVLSGEKPSAGALITRPAFFVRPA